LAVFGQTASNPLGVCVAVVDTWVQKDKYKIYAERPQQHPSRRREVSSSVILRLWPCKKRSAKEKSTSSQEILWEDVLL
jgi:hypothetical protein